MKTNENPNAVKEFRAAVISLTAMVEQLASVVKALQNEASILVVVANSLEARPENDLEEV